MTDLRRFSLGRTAGLWTLLALAASCADAPQSDEGTGADPQGGAASGGAASGGDGSGGSGSGGDATGGAAGGGAHASGGAPAGGGPSVTGGGGGAMGGGGASDGGASDGGAGGALGGAGGELTGGDATGGAGSGGQVTGGDATGGDATGGAGSGGQATGGDATGGAGSGGQATGGDATGGGGGGSPPEDVRFGYFGDGENLRFRSEEGLSGVLAPLGGAIPAVFRFQEADVDETGLFSHRRTSALLLRGGVLYRVDGQADAHEPPAPVVVSTLSGVNQLCDFAVIAHPSDRAQSHLLIAASATASCASGVFHARVPLTAAPDDAPLAWDGVTRPARDVLGTTYAYLRLSGGLLRAVTSYEDSTVLADLLPLVFVNSYYLHSLGDGVFLLVVQKGNALWDIYRYDAVSGGVSAALGKDFSFIDGPGGYRNHTDEALFFTATKAGVKSLYRLKKDGSQPAQALALATDSPRVLAVADGRLYYTLGPAGPKIQSVDVDEDFVSPSPVVLLDDAQVSAAFLSEDRLFYTRVLNSVEQRLGVIGLDGSGQEELSSPSMQWVGCVYDAAADRPESPDTGLCRTGLAWSYFHGDELRTYDTGPGGDEFFTDAGRGPTIHGELAPTYVQSVWLGANLPGFELTGRFWAKDTIPDGYTYGVWAMGSPGSADPSLAEVWSPTADAQWLN